MWHWKQLVIFTEHAQSVNSSAFNKKSKIKKKTETRICAKYTYLHKMPSNRFTVLIRWFWSAFSRYMCVCDAGRALQMILTAQPLLCLCSGLLDAESSLTERSEHFFSELRVFRQVNKDECVHSGSSWSEGKPHVATLLCFSLSFYPVLCDFLYVWEYMLLAAWLELCFSYGLLALGFTLAREFPPSAYLHLPVMRGTRACDWQKLIFIILQSIFVYFYIYTRYVDAWPSHPYAVLPQTVAMSSEAPNCIIVFALYCIGLTERLCRKRAPWRVTVQRPNVSSWPQ